MLLRILLIPLFPVAYGVFVGVFFQRGTYNVGLNSAVAGGMIFVAVARDSSVVIEACSGWSSRSFDVPAVPIDGVIRP